MRNEERKNQEQQIHSTGWGAVENLVMREVLHVSPVMPVDERHIEAALDTTGIPGSLVTSWLPRPWERTLLEAMPPRQVFLRREPVRLLHRRVFRSFAADMTRGFKLATGWPPIACHDALFRRVDEAAAARITPDTSAVIGRELGCLQSFQRAKESGALCIHHMPIAHHDAMRVLFEREQAAFGNICHSTFDPMEFESCRMADKSEELRMADRIWCPSVFVKNSLVAAGLDEERMAVLPFGGESEWLTRYRPKPDGSFLFVGSISARKGAHRLLRAWKKLGAHRTNRLLLIGAMHLTPAFLQDYKGLYEHVPRVLREDLADHYLRASALALPSLAEGFALVILEALSCGTPVLVSRNSGAAGFLKEDEEARFCDAEDDDSLCAALEWALTHPDELEEMGRAGRRKAAAWTWDHFENAVIEELRGMRLP